MNNEFVISFKEFLEKEVMPATKELEKFSSAASRKHVQKLVYTNMVDRLDFCIDNTLLAFLETSDVLIDEMLEKHREPALRSQVLELILAKNPRDEALNSLKDTLRGSILRQRHSEKLQKLLLLMEEKPADLKRSRVNPSSGAILESFTSQNNQIPTSIIGYSDWLYSRRNSIVHGGGQKKLLKNDFEQLKKRFSVSPASTVKLSLRSIMTASNFYSELLKKFLLQEQTQSPSE